MRVLMVSWEYPPLVTGGLAAHVEGLSVAMAAAGHEPVVLTRAHHDAADDAVVDGVRVLRAHHDLPWVPFGDFYGYVVSANHHLAKLLARLGDWRPDVVHVHDWLGAWAGDVAATLLDRPLVATIHATERGRHQGHLPGGMSEAINAAEWWLTFRAHRVICCSDFMVEQVAGSFQTPRDKLVMVPNGVDASRWQPRPDDVPAVDGTAPTIVTWGRLEYEKGFQTVIDAMWSIRERVPGARLVIVGRGTYADELRRHAWERGLGDIVRFAGFVPEDELRRLLNGAACAVIPSFYEPFGIVALEALAAGAPVVAAASGGLKEVLHDSGAGLLFRPGDAADCAHQVSELLTRPDFAASARARARELLATRYSWHTIAAQTVGVYAGVVGAPPSAARE